MAAATGDPIPQERPGTIAAPPAAASVSARLFKSTAMVTGMPASEHTLGSGSVVAPGNTLTSAATSTLAPFNSMSGIQLSLAAGPTAPVRFGLVAGAVNDGLGAPPFAAVYREGRVEIDTMLTLPGGIGSQWDVTVNAAVQATWGAGIGCSQLQIDIGDDGVWETTWGCMQPTLQQAMVGTSVDNGGLRVRVRLTGEARSWTTSTPDHFLLHLVLDCTPLTQADYSADFGIFDLETVASRVGDRVSLAAVRERRAAAAVQPA